VKNLYVQLESVIKMPLYDGQKYVSSILEVAQIAVAAQKSKSF
jgi:hypothetical protein